MPWQAAFTKTSHELAALFRKNFQKYQDHPEVSGEILAQGPTGGM
jgi:hypothetical protein